MSIFVNNFGDVYFNVFSCLLSECVCVCVCVCVCERESDIFTVILLKRSISFSFITVPMSSMAFRTICHDNNNHSSPCQRLQVPRFSPPSLTPSKSYTDTCKRSSIYSFSLWKCCYLKFFFFWLSLEPEIQVVLLLVINSAVFALMKTDYNICF